MEGHARRDGLVLDVAMVRDHRHDLPVELAAAPAPEQVQEAVVMARDEDGDALTLAPEAELPVHLEARGNVPVKFRLQTLAPAGFHVRVCAFDLRAGRLRQEELGAQEEPPPAPV